MNPESIVTALRRPFTDYPGEQAAIAQAGFQQMTNPEHWYDVPLGALNYFTSPITAAENTMLINPLEEAGVPPSVSVPMIVAGELMAGNMGAWGRAAGDLKPLAKALRSQRGILGPKDKRYTGETQNPGRGVFQKVWRDKFTTESGVSYRFDLEKLEPMDSEVLGLGGGKIVQDALPDPWHAAFMSVKGGKSDIGVTGEGHSAKVMTTIADMLSRAARNVRPGSIVFTAEEPSRQRLYNSMVKRVFDRNNQYIPAKWKGPDGKIDHKLFILIDKHHVDAAKARAGDALVMQ